VSTALAKAPETPHGTKPLQGSLRKKLWDLPSKLHCPVVGSCIHLSTLRQLVNKLFTDGDKVDDYNIHVGVIHECRSRSLLANELHKLLEKCHASAIQTFRAAKTKLAVAQLWEQALTEGSDIQGAFWAACTHARCDEELHDVLYKDMHMLQHQMGVATQADIRQLNTLTQENAVLTRELARIQERITRQMHEKTLEIEKLKCSLQEATTRNIGKDWEIGCLNSKLDHLQSSVTELESRKRLTEINKILEDKIQAQQEQIADLKRSILSLEQKHIAARALKSAGRDTEDVAEPNASSNKTTLQEKAILCVGGRTSNIPNYRHVIESTGAKFVYHDGGLENNSRLLEASLAAADLVICQAGCISHNAYWRVKDHCKRTGKQCLFVENPSASSLIKGLEQIVDK